MDCEKFESAMMDELYDELDEVTSAAVKRHVAGCCACGALYEGLRATRRVAVLPAVEPPFDLENRILAATYSALPTVPFGRRAARAISVAGSWAMRPQTAMAAVFLVMIGTSGLLLRGKSSRAPASAAMTVTEEGTPAPMASAPPLVKHEPSTPEFAAAPKEAPPVHPSEPSVSTLSPSFGFANAPDVTEGRAPRATTARALPQLARPLADSPTNGTGDETAPAKASSKAPNAPTMAAGARANDIAPAAKVAREANPAAPKTTFDTALAAYRARRFDEAARGFDSLSATDPSAALWESRSIRDGSGGCGAAVTRFDEVMQRFPNTESAWNAGLEGARCYRNLGNADAARSRLLPLLGVDGVADRARVELDGLSRGQPPAASPAGRP